MPLETQFHCVRTEGVFGSCNRALPLNMVRKGSENDVSLVKK